MSLEVLCVTMEEDPDYPDCRGIAKIGLPGAKTEVVTKTPPEVHELLEERDIYVQHEGEKTDLIQATYEGYKYVRTEPNDTEEDNLLKQESC